MKSNHPFTPLVWIEIALFMCAAVFLLLGVLYMFITLIILPLF